MKRFLILGLDAKAGTNFLRYAQKRGLSLVLGDTEANLDLVRDLLPFAEDVLHFDFRDGEAAVKAGTDYHAEKPLDGVFTYREFGVLPTAMIAEALGLPGNPVEAIHRIRNKHITRHTLRTAGRPQPTSVYCETYEDALNTFRADRPWIVKPPASFGSIGVHKVTDEQELAEAVRHVRAIGETAFLLEEFIEGHEYSVEGIIDQGRAHTLAVTEKHTTGAPSFVETGHILPAPLSETLRAKIAEEVAVSLDILGLRMGIFHVEVFVTPDEQVIIGEVHNRQGGDYIDVLLEQALEVEFNGLALDQLLGHPLHLEPYEPKRVAAIQFLCPSEGTIAHVEGLDNLLHHPNVTHVNLALAPGTVIPKMDSSFARSGSFIVNADTYAGARRLTQDLLNGIRIEYQK